MSEQVRSREVGVEHFEDSPQARANFRIAIFGSSAEVSMHDKLAMQQARGIAGHLVESGFSIATGGENKGVMKAASEGATLAAVTTHWRAKVVDEPVESFLLDERLKQQPVPATSPIRSRTLIERLGHLIDESCGFVVLSGKTGTVVELLTALHSEHVRQAPARKPFPRPLIIVDASFEHGKLLTDLQENDPKLAASSVLAHTYVMAGDAPWEHDVQRIVELYYQQARGRQPTKEEEDFLNRARYKVLKAI